MLALLIACTPASSPDPASAPPAAPSHLVYVEGQTLRAHELASGASRVVGTLPSADVALNPDGTAYAVVRETHPNGPRPEGFRRPVVAIGSTSDQDEPLDLGPGRSPMWSPDGAAIAAIALATGGEQIVVYDTSGAQLASSPADRGWSLVGWGPGEVVAIGSDAGAVTISESGGAVSALGTTPAELWGASPSDTTVMLVSAGGARLQQGSANVTVRGVSGALADGAWSWTGRHVAAVEIVGGRSTLVLIDVASGRSTDVRGGRGAEGNVVWSLDGETFAFVRVDPDARSLLQAVVCHTDLVCEPAFSWSEGVRLLGFRSN